MRQFVLPAEWDGEPECIVQGREARYLGKVLRLGTGDRFPAVDRRGTQHLCEILGFGAGNLRLAVSPIASRIGSLPDIRRSSAGEKGGSIRTGNVKASPLPDFDPGASNIIENVEKRPRIILAASILKGEKYDLVLRQAAETGIAVVIPLITSRTIGSARVENRPGRRERHERVIKEALQQSGSMVATRLDDPVPLRQLPARIGPSQGTRLGLVLHEAPLVEDSLHRYLVDSPDEIVICVGPEGGFSAEEVDFLRESGFRPLRLPGAILRAETAALFAVAAVETIRAERGAWHPEMA